MTSEEVEKRLKDVEVAELEKKRDAIDEALARTVTPMTILVILLVITLFLQMAE